MAIRALISRFHSRTIIDAARLVGSLWARAVLRRLAIDLLSTDILSFGLGIFAVGTHGRD